MFYHNKKIEKPIYVGFPVTCVKTHLKFYNGWKILNSTIPEFSSNCYFKNLIVQSWSKSSLDKMLIELKFFQVIEKVFSPALLFSFVCVSARLLQSCPTLCGPMDCSLPGSSVQGFSKQERWSGLPGYGIS